MSELERVETGLGEECGVFGAYDMDGGDVAPSVYYGLFALGAEGRKLRNCSDRYLWQAESSFQKGTRTCQ